MKQNKIYLKNNENTKKLLDELIGLDNVKETKETLEFTLDYEELILSDIMILLIEEQRKNE